jgi:2-C-methyl-D-erythritol 4-phosphate cytidylyltransferase/2-C-methyl-D-erythritol 2,4-cyclodiphosphate synthase
MNAAKIAAIIPAAGTGRRMQQAQPKQFLTLCGAPILVRTVQIFFDHEEISEIVVAVPEDYLAEATRLLEESGLSPDRVRPVVGGKRRQDSVRRALASCSPDIELVVVHDGARPLVTPALISRCCAAARETGAAVAAVPVKDTLKKTAAGQITATVDRSGLYQAQTPQVARKRFLEEGYRFNDAQGDKEVTDEASLLELAGLPVALVEGNETNIKITRPEDLGLAEIIMRQGTQARPTPFRVGHGYDAHRLTSGRKLVLGGIQIDHHLGLAGHSDADVLTHALCDALLGALGAGDIGRHFPDSDERYKGIYSIELLKHVVKRCQDQGYRLGNADLTIVCQAPKLAPYLDEMKNLLAKICGLEHTSVNIKATTTEKMGFAGREEGIACHAVVLLYRDPNV